MSLSFSGAKQEQALLYQALSEKASKRGLRLVELKMTQENRELHLAVFLESQKLDENPLSLDDLAKETRWISEFLDELDPIQSRFVLDVSSPGLNRRLSTQEDFQRFVGERIRIRYKNSDSSGILTRKARLLSFENDMLELEDEKENFFLEFSAIEKARLEPDFSYMSSEKKTFKKSPKKATKKH